MDENKMRIEANKMTHRDKITEIYIRTTRIEEHMRGMNGMVKDHEDRIRTNETFKNKLIGATGVVGVITSVLSIMAFSKSVGMW